MCHHVPYGAHGQWNWTEANLDGVGETDDEPGVDAERGSDGEPGADGPPSFASEERSVEVELLEPDDD